ncbi:MAG: FAD-binding oxidoreductase [bacterium]|nr:FAD-binding oxidoreductase [bacterium]
MGQTSCDILIVGAGLAGAATAYHLRRSGAEGVVIVEREDLPGVHSSGRNAAMIRGYVENPRVGELVREGAEFVRTGELAEFRASGSVLLGLGEEEVAPRVPPAVGRGLWCPNDGVVDVSGLLHGYLREQDVRYGTRVLGWRRAGERLEVDTTRGRLSCRLLVNAAGPWAGEVGDLPLTPLNRHLCVTPPSDALDPDWPFVWDIPGGFYFRPESGGLLLCACNEHAASPGDYDACEPPLEALALHAQRVLPGFSDLRVKECWAGQRTFAPDREFVIGHDSRCGQLIHVAGLGGQGVGGSWAVGRLAAERILEGRTAPNAVFCAHRLMDCQAHTVRPA